MTWVATTLGALLAAIALTKQAIRGWKYLWVRREKLRAWCLLRTDPSPVRRVRLFSQYITTHQEWEDVCPDFERVMVKVCAAAARRNLNIAFRAIEAMWWELDGSRQDRLRDELGEDVQASDIRVGDWLWPWREAPLIVQSICSDEDWPYVAVLAEEPGYKRTANHMGEEPVRVVRRQ